MKGRPVLTIPLSKSDFVVEALCIIIIMGMCVYGVYIFQVLPDQIPIHFNRAGKVDKYGSKVIMWFLPILSILLYALLTWLHRIPHQYNYPVAITKENAFIQYQLATKMMRWVKLGTLGILGFAFYDVIQSAVSTNREGLNPWLFFGIILISYSPLFFYLNQSRKNK